jgi:REP element-mobilizing transposase RayT
MPNHVHAVIPIRATRNSIPNFVGATLAVAHDVDTVARNSVAHDADMVVQNTPAVAGHKSDVQNNTTMVGTVEGATARIAPTKIMNPKISENMKKITIGDIVGAYKSLVANACLKIYKSKNERMGILWQRNYYEHIIRDNKSLHFIRKYIQENPLNWFDDMENHLNKEILELEMVEIREP